MVTVTRTRTGRPLRPRSQPGDAREGALPADAEPRPLDGCVRRGRVRRAPRDRSRWLLLHLAAAARSTRSLALTRVSSRLLPLQRLSPRERAGARAAAQQPRDAAQRALDDAPRPARRVEQAQPAGGHVGRQGLRGGDRTRGRTKPHARARVGRGTLMFCIA
eukprot:3818159-Prymnesium_polylepis.2